MKKNTFLNLLVIIAITITFSSCKNNPEKNKIDDVVTDKASSSEASENESQEETVVQTYAAFDSYNAGYDKSSGEFSKTMAVPRKTVRINNQDVLLEPSVQMRQDLSTNNIPIMFELLQHKKDYLDSLELQPVTAKTQQGNLNTILTGFDPSLGKKVYVISMHDEEFGNLSDAQKNTLFRAIVEQVEACEKSPSSRCNIEISESLLKELDIDILRPRTVGNGVIPPR